MMNEYRFHRKEIDQIRKILKESGHPDNHSIEFMPKGWISFNASNEPCDVLIGPCHCGATH